jgi:hypothetical protein
MGMYTGLRFKGVVKQEFREMIDEINQGAEWSEFTEQYPFLKEYAKQDRAEFIPRGALSYMPNEWEVGKFPSQTPADGFDNSINMENGYWSFQCSLKNYNGEIQHFLKEVLPEIIDSSDHIEYYYEEWARSKFYELKDGKIIESDREGELYGYEETEDRWY